MDKLFESTYDGLKLDYMASYAEFIINEQFDDKILYLSTLGEDTKLLESGRLVSLNEGFVASVVDFIAKITEVISNVIEKFVSNIRKFIGMDEKFLAKYENTIIKGETLTNSEDKITGYRDYTKATAEIITGAGNFAFANTISQIDWDRLQTNAEQWKDISKFVNDNKVGGLSDYDANDQKSLKEEIIKNAVGPATDLKAGDVDRSRRNLMFKYCKTDCQEVIKSIEKARDILKAKNREFAAKLDQMKAEASRPSNAPESNTPVNQAQEQEAATLESTLEMYFHEDGVKIEKAPKPANPEAGDGEEKTDKWADLTATIKNYYNSFSKMLSAEMTIANDAYRSYMKILRWYVSVAKPVGNNADNGKAKTDEKDQNADTSKLKQ